MTFRFRRKKKTEWLVLFALIMPFTFFVLINLLRVPSLIKYTIDIAWVLMLMSMLYDYRTMPNRESQKLLTIVLVFWLATLIGTAINYQSVLYYLWGFRNNMRFYVFFFACIFYLREESIAHYYRFLDVVFWINLLMSLFQFFVLGLRQDYLGGIFGVEKGCNAYTNILLVIICAGTILKYMNGQEKFWNSFLKCGAALAIAALAELKVFIVELVIVIAAASLMTKFSLRKLWIMLCIGFCGIVAIQVLVFLSPHFAGWFNLQSMWETATSDSGYTMSNDMNRLTAFSISLNRFLLKGSEKLFGLGLGNCDYSTAFTFLATPFYLQNRLLHYTWFSSAFLLLETGIVGLCLYLLFFVAVFINAGKRGRTGKANIVYCQMAQIMSIIGCLMVIYNSSLRIEAAYMLFFVLAVPFVNNGRDRTVSAAMKLPERRKVSKL